MLLYFSLCEIAQLPAGLVSGPASSFLAVTTQQLRRQRDIVTKTFLPMS